MNPKKRVFGKAAISLAMLLPLTVLGGSSAHASSVVGGKCAKARATYGTGANKLTCTLSRGKLTWVKTPNIVVGSFKNPIKTGYELTVGGIGYSVSSFTPDITSDLCAAHPDNDGCTLDDNSSGIVDPSSTSIWASLDLGVSNNSTELFQSGIMTSYYIVMPTGQLLQSQDFASIDNGINDLQVVPGGTGDGQIAFQFPQGIDLSNILFMMRLSNGFSGSRDFYFQVSQ